MIIKRTETPAVSSQGETIGVKIALNAKVFNMLYLDLYQYKYEAAVREVICNAIDSHVEAGITDPIKVYVPTELNPVFKVEDFGVGMSQDRLVNVYCTVSATSKDQTNNQVGMLGVGAFAPFGYTSAFNVLNGYQGTSQMLTVYQDEGIPQVKVDTTFESDYQGVTVSYPVASSDLHRFRTACQRVLREFTSPIEVHGMDVEYADVEYSFNIDVTYEDKPVKVEILKDETYFRGSQVSAVMGNIRYPVNEVYVPIHYTRKVRVHVPIGAVDFMNNREDLNIEGSKSTREFLKAIREGIKAKSEEFVRVEVDKIKHPVERAVYANNMDSVFDVPSELKGLDKEERILHIPAKDVEYIKTKVGKGCFVWLREAVLGDDKGKTFMCVNPSQHVTNEKVYIVIQDDKTAISHTVKHVRSLMRINRWSTHETLIVVKKGCSQETIDSITEFLGNTVTVKKTSEMTVPIPTRKKGAVVKKEPEAWFATTTKGNLETLEQEKGKKYVICLRGFEDGRLDFLRDMNYKVYYTSEHKYEKAMENYTFLTFEEALKDVLDTTGVTCDGYEEYVKNKETLSALPNWFEDLLEEYPDLDIVKKFSPDAQPLQDVYSKVDNYYSRNPYFTSKGLFDRKLENTRYWEARKQIRKEFDDYLYENHPLLLKLEDRDYDEKQLKHLVAVINM